jgi:hypothetical protein
MGSSLNSHSVRNSSIEKRVGKIFKAVVMHLLLWNDSVNESQNDFELLIKWMSVRVNFVFEKSGICIENSTKLKTWSHFSIQFSIENHSKWHLTKLRPWNKFRVTNTQTPSVWVNFAFEKSGICIENSTKLKTWSHFSIQFSIENHSKWQPRTGRLVDW